MGPWLLHVLALSLEVARLSPSALAYLGDSVFETHARRAFLWPPRPQNDLCLKVRALSCAKGQSDALASLQKNPHFRLTEAETEWLRRGRNAAGRGPRSASPTVYRAASSLETLIGFLHLTNATRCAEVMDRVVRDFDALSVET